MFLCTLGLMVSILRIIYDVLQQYYDSWHGPESWSSLLTSPLAENNMHVHSDNPSRNTINACFERRETHRIFRGVFSCTDTKTRS